MISCPGCGASLTYDIKSSSLLCTYCGDSYDPYQFNGKSEDAKADRMNAAVYHCPGCGAKLMTDRTDLSAVCSYCGGANLIFDRMEKKLRPQAIVPFSLTKEEAAERYLHKAKFAVFSSLKYRKKSVVEDFRGIYMPFWSYRVAVDDTVATEVEYTNREGDYLVTYAQVNEAVLNATLEGYAHDASQSFDDTISECLAPYNRCEEKPFTPGYLCGMYADASDTQSEQYIDNARETADIYIARRLKNEINPDATNIITPSKCKVTARRVLYPMWFLSVRTGNSISYAAVNGSTGKVVADFPMNIPWVVSFAIVLSALIFGFMNAVIMPTPLITVIIASSFTFIGIILNWREYQQLLNRDIKKSRPFIKVKKDFNFAALFMISSGTFLFISVTFINTQLSLSIRLFTIGLIFLIFFLIDIIRTGGKQQSKVVQTRVSVNESLFSPMLLLSLVIVEIAPVLVFLVSQSIARFSIYVCALIMVILSITTVLFNSGKKKAYRRNLIIVLICMLNGTLAVIIGKPLNAYYYLWSICCTFTFLIFFAGSLHYHTTFSKRRPPQFDKGGKQA